MHLMMKQIMALVLMSVFVIPAFAQDEYQPTFVDLDLDIEALDSGLWVASNTDYQGTPSNVPNIPDSAFKKPAITMNNVHMYLGLASLAFGGLTAISADGAKSDPDLLNTVHYKSAKAAWQLGAAAIGTGLWTHWDDFHIEDGLLDRDNLHVILGTLGVVGYYLAVKSAVDEYNSRGYPTTSHASKGIFGGGAMLTAIVLTW